MPAFISHHPSLNGPADQREVAYQINHFVPGALVRKPETVFNRAVRVDDQNVTGAKMRSYSAGLKLFRLRFEQKSPGRRKVLLKTIRRHPAAENLPADTCMAAVIKVVGNI